MFFFSWLQLVKNMIFQEISRCLALIPPMSFQAKRLPQMELDSWAGKPWISGQTCKGFGEILKGCRPCRRPLTEETAKFDADDEHEDKQWKHGPISNIIWQTCWDDFRDTERKWHVNRQSHKKFKAFAVCLKNQILHLAVCFYSGLGIHLQKPQQQQGSCPRHAKHEPQKLFHVTFRIHKKQCFGPREIWPWNTASESLEQQNTSGSLRCEKSQTPSGHEPKTAKTRSKKLFLVIFGIHKKQSFGPREIWPWNTASESLEQQNTSPKASNSKTQAVALDAKSPKHHLDTSRKRPKPEPKHSFTLPLESTKNNLLGLAKCGLGTPLPKASNSKTQAVALDAKSPKHHLDTSRKRPKPDPKNSFTLPLESTKNNLLGLAKSGLGTPLPKASNSKTQAV